MIGQSISSMKSRDPIRWRSDVGRMHYRNRIQVEGGAVLFSTSGEEWNAPDDKDGFGCLSATTGELKWFFPTSADANEFIVLGDVIVGGTDDGSIYAVSRKDGKLLAQSSSSSPVVSRPVAVTRNGRLQAISISTAGEVVCFDPLLNIFESVGKLSGSNVWANPATSSQFANDGIFFVGTVSGAIVEADVSGEQAAFRYIHELSASSLLVKPSSDVEIMGVTSLLICRDVLIISYVRNSYDTAPPIRAISLVDGRTLWDAKRIKTASKRKHQFGNARAIPVIWHNSLLMTFGYDDSVYSLSLRNGSVEWKLQIDSGWFQNWASPVLDGDTLLLSRVNGVLVSIDLPSRSIKHAVSIEVPLPTKRERDIPEHLLKDMWQREPWPDVQWEGLLHDGPAVGQPLSGGLASTPAVHDGIAYVGTVSGQIAAIDYNSTRLT